MRLPAIPPTYLLAAGAVLAAVAWVSLKGPRAAAASVGSAAVDLADGVVSGTVVAIGERVGVPATNQTECQRAKAEGRTWDASFACPAGDFIRYLWN